MGVVVDLTTWSRSGPGAIGRRDRRSAGGTGTGRAGVGSRADGHLARSRRAARVGRAVVPDGPPGMDRLEAAVDRLQGLVAGALDGRGRVAPAVETELLAIVGELTVGLVPEAASRAERLVRRLETGG